LEEASKAKLTSAERLEAKVKAALEKRDRLLEALDKEISGLEGRLVKAKELRAKLGGETCQAAPSSFTAPPTGPLQGFRSNGRTPSRDPIDALIREGKIG
jgi:hypothetical protein